jgi:transcription factor C subunit 6
VQNICWVRLPQTDINATPNLTEDPTMICTVGSEGSLKITDIRDCLPRALVRNREVPHSIAYSSFCGAVVATDVDFLVKMYQVQPSALGKGHHVMDIGGAALVSII